jgi:hypothetical protein
MPDCGGAIERIQESTLAVPLPARAAVVILEERAELAEEIAELPSSANAQNLLDLAKARRELAERARQIATQFPTIWK